ncbi:MAG: nucleoside phosphorylase [Chitinophagaceae bacterium]|nr:nucleoside phosphorylase [Chitinophagaceae bacterium]MBK9382337.1 nucleoside phosphorylase [Chitinophagaceae bacterium]HQV60304.1 nucleoside phosphorylase [Chitinophagaceae bacterium]HQV86293.1 nucleoside phosphorylase [Chitinophagaceae bacterium]HQX73431.1 nucleoside phosphorylase [Chitinophagaceae bacterium]
MSRIAESELIINDRGAVYHIDLRPDELGDTVVTVGDPDRVREVSKYFDKIEVKRQHREFISHTGYIGKKRITVLSSGIGPDNIDIVINELDALVNIDFETREVKKQLKSLNIIRIGTSGSLQADIPVDSFVASTHGLGIDNLLNFYRYEQNDEEQQLIHSFVTHTQIHGQIGHPYITSGAASLIKHFVKDFYHGITVTCPGFYGPQGRILRLGIRNPELINRLTDFRFGQHRITNFEMETSAIYGLGKLLGHNCLAVNAIVANRIKKEFSKDGKAAVENLIKKFIQLFSENI